jgi:hypothetical protein
MRAFLITFVIAILLLGAGAYYFWKNPDKLPEGSMAQKAGEALQEKEPEVPARKPQNYHLLEAQGGIPKDEAERAGLATAEYAYLRTFEPLQVTEGITETEAIVVRGLNYDFAYSFESTPPGEQYLEFNLNRNWSELHFGFGFDDNHPSDPEAKWAIELTIQADGKQIYGPQRITPVDKPIFSRIDVAGVTRVTFVSKRIGTRNPFKPSLLDPFVLASAAGES